MPQPKTEARRETARREKQQKKLRRRRVLIVFLGVILVGLILWGIVEVARRILVIRHVEVTGESRYTAEELLATADVELQENILLYKTEPVRKKILAAYPYVEDVVVHKKLPDTIILEIVKQEPAAVLEYNGSYLYISGNEKILEIGKAPLQGLPCFTGFKLYHTQPGETLELENEMTLQVYRNLCGQMEAEDAGKISLIDVRDIHNVGMLYEERVYMRLGTAADLEYKIRFGLKVMENKDGSGIGPEERGILDLTLAPENNKAYFTET